MKTGRFILLLGILAVLLAACASATKTSAPVSTQDIPLDTGDLTMTPGNNGMQLNFPPDTPILIWHREGGIAGFCDDVTVFANGTFTVENCRGNAAVRNEQLNADQMTQLASWVNTFTSFTDGDDDTTPTYPDQMFLKTVFKGAGAVKASPEEIIAISNFASTLTVKTEPVGAGQYPQAALSARDFLANELSLSSDAIKIVSVEAVEWSDSCLGLGRADEMCAQMITPGYKVILEAQGQSYELHTDANGENIRQAI